jgi:hypothetical protein
MLNTYAWLCYRKSRRKGRSSSRHCAWPMQKLINTLSDNLIVQEPTTSWRAEPLSVRCFGGVPWVLSLYLWRSRARNHVAIDHWQIVVLDRFILETLGNNNEESDDFVSLGTIAFFILPLGASGPGCGGSCAVVAAECCQFFFYCKAKKVATLCL